jgi:hypothetical protein
MAVDGTTIAAQQGAAAGLWTHTPVDWKGNEARHFGVNPAQPVGWPQNAYDAVPPAGNRTAAVAPP